MGIPMISTGKFRTWETYAGDWEYSIWWEVSLWGECSLIWFCWGLIVGSFSSRESRTRVLILLGSKNSVGNSHTVAECLLCWRVKTQDSGKTYSASRMRIFILSGISGGWEYANLLGKQKWESSFRRLGQKVGCMPIYWGFKDENLHSVNGIRSLGVCQSSKVSRMRIFILLTVSGAWEYTNLLRFQGWESSFLRETDF